MVSIFTDEAGEYRLLGAMIDEPSLVLRMTPALFTGSRIGVFTAMQKAYATYGEITGEGVERFMGKPVPQEVEIARGSRYSAVIDKLTDLATRRQMVDLSERLAIAASATAVDRAYIGKTMKLDPILSNEDSSVDSGVGAFISELTSKRSDSYRFVDTGLLFLNHMLGHEWPRQALTILMGQAGGGKTALVCQSILNMAAKGIPVLFASLEMPKHRLISRFVANISGVDGVKIRSGKVDDEELARINNALEYIQSLPIYIVDNTAMTVDSIIYQIKLHKELYNIDAFFVDYLQIVSRDVVSDNDSEQLGYITQRLRNVAVELNISGIALSQQNRQFKGLASLLGSGRISHIADSVIEITLEESSSDEQRLCTLTFWKNRDGPVGACNSIYRPRYLKFE